MCGRYTLTTPPSVVAEHFRVAELPNFPPRYNIAPTQQALVVKAGQGKRELAFLRWGLIPSWAKDPAIGSRMLNARPVEEIIMLGWMAIAVLLIRWPSRLI